MFGADSWQVESLCVLMRVRDGALVFCARVMNTSVGLDRMNVCVSQANMVQQCQTRFAVYPKKVRAFLSMQRTDRDKDADVPCRATVQQSAESHMHMRGYSCAFSFLQR